MNGRLAKAIRKANKRHWQEYYKAMREQKFMVRFDFAWWLLFGKNL